MLLDFFFCALLLAEDDFALADELIVEPETILVGGALEADAGRAAQQAHACRGLKNIGRKGAAVDVEFDAKIASIGDPGDLITRVKNDDLRYESNEYGTLCHFSSTPYFHACCQQDAKQCTPLAARASSCSCGMHYIRFVNSSMLTFKSRIIPRRVFRFNSPFCMGITTRAWSLART